MTPELKKAIEDQQTNFEAFKAANDERIGQLEKGAADFVTVAKLTAIEESIQSTQAKIDTLVGLDKRLDEVELQLARPSFGGQAGGVSAPQLLAHFNRDLRALGRLGANDETDAEQLVGYSNNFERLLRAGLNRDAIPGEIRNTMSVGSDPDGGYAVKPEMSMEMERRIFETSPMRQIARTITIGSDAWEAPYKSDDATSGGWVAEMGARSGTATPQTGMQRIQVHEQYAYPEVTQKMLDDGGFDVEGFLVDETEDGMIRTENTGFVSGDGVNKPRGFLDYSSDAVTTADASRNWGLLQYVATGASAGFPAYSGTTADDPGPLIDLMAELNPVYVPGAVWAMARRTEAAIRKLRDADGRYLVEFGRLADGVFGFSLHGHTIANLEDMPAIAANSFSVAFGNFMRGYYIIDRLGFRVLRDPYTNKPYVGLYITKRVGGDVRNFDAIKLLKFGTS